MGSRTSRRISVRALMDEARRSVDFGEYRQAIDKLHDAFRMTGSKTLVPRIIVDLTGAHVGAEDLTGCWYYTQLFYKTLTWEQQEPYLALMVSYTGGAYELMGRWQDAVESYQMALIATSSIHPDFPKEHVLLRLAGCLARIDRRKEAGMILGALADLKSPKVNLAELRYTQALLALMEEKPDQAARAARKALSCQGASPQVQSQACMVLADVHQDKLEWSVAREWLQEAGLYASVADSDRLGSEVVDRMNRLDEEEVLAGM